MAYLTQRTKHRSFPFFIWSECQIYQSCLRLFYLWINSNLPTLFQKAEQQYCFKEQVIQTTSQNDYVKNLTSAAQQADLVFAIGFLMQTPLDQVARHYPQKKFAIIDGCAEKANASSCDNIPNVAPLFFKEQEAGCLVGA